MAQPGEQGRNPRIIEEFKRRRKAQLMVTIPVIAAVILLAWFQDRPSGSITGLTRSATTGFLVAAIVGLVVFSLRNWRCPACDRYLGKGFSPNYCPRCGVPLQ